MPYNEVQKRAVKKYNSKAYEEFKVRVHKGEKGKITEHAKNRSESTNGFITRAIYEAMERDNMKEGE